MREPGGLALEQLSSYAATIGLTEPHSFVNPSRILGCFGGPPELARARLRAFVNNVTEL